MTPLMINTALKALFEKKAARTNAKAAKLGMKAVDFAYGVTEEAPCGSDTIGAYKNAKGRTVALYTEVFLIGDAPVVEGYEFIATVDLRGSSPMVKRQPFTADDVDLSPYFESDGHCDHCNSVRQRNDVLILREVVTGKLIQIGRNCAADFFRSKDAKAMVAVCDWADAYGNVTDPSGRAEPYTSVERMYEVAAAVVRVFGWVRHQDAKYDNSVRSTRSRVWQNLFPSPEVRAKYPEDYISVTEADVAEAALVMDWLRARFLDKDPAECSDFERNVKAAVEVFGEGALPMCRDRNLNFLIWGIAGYQRDLQKEAEERRRQAEKAEQAQESDFVGVVGERRDFALTLLSKRAFGSDFGVRYMQKFADVDGNVIVWWGTNEVSACTIVGNSYVFKATIKGHEVFEECKRTILTRAALVEGVLAE